MICFLVRSQADEAPKPKKPKKPKKPMTLRRMSPLTVLLSFLHLSLAFGQTPNQTQSPDATTEQPQAPVGERVTTCAPVFQAYHNTNEPNTIYFVGDQHDHEYLPRYFHPVDDQALGRSVQDLTGTVWGPIERDASGNIWLATHDEALERCIQYNPTDTQQDLRLRREEFTSTAEPLNRVYLASEYSYRWAALFISDPLVLDTENLLTASQVQDRQWPLDVRRPMTCASSTQDELFTPPSNPPLTSSETRTTNEIYLRQMGFQPQMRFWSSTIQNQRNYRVFGVDSRSIRSEAIPYHSDRYAFRCVRRTMDMRHKNCVNSQLSSLSLVRFIGRVLNLANNRTNGTSLDAGVENTPPANTSANAANMPDANAVRYPAQRITNRFRCVEQIAIRRVETNDGMTIEYQPARRRRHK